MIHIRQALLCMLIAPMLLHAMNDDEILQPASSALYGTPIISVDYNTFVELIHNMARQQGPLNKSKVQTDICKTSKLLTTLLQPYHPKPPAGWQFTGSGANEALYIAHMNAGLGNVASVVGAMVEEIDQLWPDKTVAPSAALIASAPHIELCYFALMKKLVRLFESSSDLQSHFQTLARALQASESSDSDLDYWSESGNVSDGESYEDLEFMSRYAAFMPSSPH